jgi:hypothetical protein
MKRATGSLAGNASPIFESDDRHETKDDGALSVMPPTYREGMLNLPSHWRAGTTSKSGAFMGGKWGRPLRLIIDHASLPDDPALRLLDAFAGRSDAQLFSTDATRAWHVEISPQPNRNQALTVSFVEPGGGGRECGVWGPPWRPHAERTVAEHGGDVDETYRALVLAQACTMHDLDGFVTSFPFAERGWGTFAQKARVQNVREAAALLGLYLRAHGDFTVQQEGNHGTFLAPHNFYAGAAVAPLRSYPDWLRLAVGRWRSARGPVAHDLLRGLELRLGRALRARDYLVVRTRALRPDDSWEEALFFFEAFLLSAAGALDALARYCHVVAALGGSREAAGWRKRDWREKRMLKARTELAPVIGHEDTRLRATTEVVGLLRNYIHGEALTQQLSDDRQPGITDYLMGKLVIGGQDGERLQAAAAHLPGLAGAVAEEWPEGVASVLPARLLPPLLANLYAAVNELMDAFALDQATLQAAEPFPLDFWVPGHPYRKNLVLLCGLPLPDAASAEP